MSAPPRRAGRRWQRGSVLLAVLLTFVRSVAAADSLPAAETVILLQPTTASPALRRTLALIQDELSADRFRVVLVDSSAPTDRGDLIETRARDGDDGTTVALFGDPAVGETELCVVRRAAKRTAVRWATIAGGDPGRMPQALATRALELLRATALELSIESERAEPPHDTPAPCPQVEIAPTPTPPPAGRVVAAIGVGIWNSVEGPPAAVIPMGRIGLRLSDRAWVRVSLAGLGSHPRIDTADGSATVSQSLALAEFAAVFRTDRRLHPILSVGVGALDVAAVGTGAAPLEGRQPQRWSAAFDGGVGIGFGLGSRSALVAELHALVAEPHPVVRFVNIRAATVGYPSLIATLALEVAP
jgi:hypothetical protein